MPSEGPTLGGAALWLYRAAGRLAAPFVRVALTLRARRGKEDRARLGERLGVASAERQPGHVTWVHAASVGETVAVLPLVQRLVDSGTAVVLTTGTTTSAAVVSGRLPEGAVHQYVPVDLPGRIKRFLDHWQPQLAIFAESELWPATLYALRRRRIPLVVVNARMSKRSFRRWNAVKWLSRSLLQQVGLFLAQAPADAARLGALGARDIATVGNLKLDAPPPPADRAIVEAHRSASGGRFVVLAASTHPGEERIVLQVHAELARRGLDPLTIAAPRHPARGSEVQVEAEKLNLPVARRGAGEAIASDTAIYVADTVGEMGLWYRLADVVILGGSLVPHGGQNPIEPAKLGVPIIHGPYVGNFAQLYDALSEAAAARCVTDAESLVRVIRELHDDAAERRRMAEAAQLCIRHLGGALNRTMLALQPYLMTFGSGDGVAARKP